MRFAVLAGVLGIAVLPVLTAGPALAEPAAAPDLSGYAETPVDPYVADGEVYFQTPDGLLCAIRPGTGIAGCDGPLPSAPAGANEILLAADAHLRGLRATANPQFVKPTGAAAPVLHAGQKISYADFVCAVADQGKTACTKGSPATAWLEISDTHTGIGPATPGLPDGYPDPNDFVASDESFVPGVGAKNIFPVFTVESGLTCKMSMFSGGEIGCDGTLPGITNGDDEVYVQLPGAVGTRRAGTPPFATPSYPGPIKSLPQGHRIDANGATCMATRDGGVACFGAAGGPNQGFLVTAEKTTTFVSPPS